MLVVSKPKSIRKPRFGPAQVRIGECPARTRSEKQVDQKMYRHFSLPSAIRLEVAVVRPSQAAPMGAWKTPLPSMSPWPEWYTAHTASIP